MNIREYERSIEGPLKKATITFLVKDSDILLGMKKRGFGVGKWNGVGGKPNPGETTINAAIRESQEEILVTPKDPELMAILNFYHPYSEQNKGWNQEVSVYVATNWLGEPEETEEMKPQWFNSNELPYSQMWWDDEIWLPMILEGRKVKASFMFDENENIIDQIVEEVNNF